MTPLLIILVLSGLSGWLWWQWTFAKGENAMLRAELSRLRGKLRALA